MMPPVNSTSFTLWGYSSLGERLHGMQEVSGSIPLSSTNIQTLAEKRGFLLFVTKFMASDLLFRCVCLPLLLRSI